MGHGAGKPLAPIVPGNRLRLGRGGLVPHPPRTGRRRSAEPGRAVPPSLPPSLLLSFPPSLPRSAPVCRAAGRHGPARPGRLRQLQRLGCRGEGGGCSGASRAEPRRYFSLPLLFLWLFLWQMRALRRNRCCSVVYRVDFGKWRVVSGCYSVYGPGRGGGELTA